MSNTGETINDLIHKVAEIGQPLSIGDDIAEQERQKLILAAEELLIAARKPEENVYLTATQVYLSDVQAFHEMLTPKEDSSECRLPLCNSNGRLRCHARPSRVHRQRHSCYKAKRRPDAAG